MAALCLCTTVTEAPWNFVPRQTFCFSEFQHLCYGRGFSLFSGERSAFLRRMTAQSMTARRAPAHSLFEWASLDSFCCIQLAQAALHVHVHGMAPGCLHLPQP